MVPTLFNLQTTKKIQKLVTPIRGFTDNVAYFILSILDDSFKFFVVMGKHATSNNFKVDLIPLDHLRPPSLGVLQAGGLSL